MQSGRFRRFGHRHSSISAVAGLCPGDDLEPAVVPLGDRRAAFHPVAAVNVSKSVVVVHRGRMNVTADHPVSLMVPGFGRQRLLERANVVDGILDLQLRPFRQRPIRCAEYAAESVENPIGGECEFVGFVTKQREPARLRHHKIEYVAVDDQIAFAIDSGVNGVFDDLDAPEMGTVVSAQEFIVVAGNVNDADTLARLAQNFLYDVIVRLRPIPGGAQRPTVEYIADEADRFGFVMAKKIEKLVGLAAART